MFSFAASYFELYGMQGKVKVNYLYLKNSLYCKGYLASSCSASSGLLSVLNLQK